MEDNFYKDEFERFLQEQANNHRMFPSDRVWRNINDKLHENKKWPALTIAGFAFLAAIVAISVYFSPGPNIFAPNTYSVSSASTTQKAEAPLLNSLTNNKDKSTANWSIQETRTSTNSSIEKVATASPATVLASAKPAVVPERQQASLTSEKVLYSFATKSTNIQPNHIDDGLQEAPIHSGAEEVAAVTENDELAGVRLTANSYFTKGSVDLPKNLLAGDEKGLKRHSVSKLINNLLKNRFSYKVYITPSLSFRRLTEDPLHEQAQYANVGGPVAINIASDVNKIVRHAPGNGIEAGFTFGYDLNNQVKVFSGLQLNVRQYLIDAYISNPEVATIALQTRTGIDSVYRSSVYRASTGLTSTELVNRYYQISVPIGLELQLLGNKNVSFNVATSIQPTYTLNNGAYMLSTNFKNYTQSGSMLRNWNVNSSLEAFLKIRSGNFKWQLGPQFRYQQLPTFTSQYPIKEHLMDYGVKIGVSKAIH